MPAAMDRGAAAERALSAGGLRGDRSGTLRRSGRKHVIEIR